MSRAPLATRTEALRRLRSASVLLAKATLRAAEAETVARNVGCAEHDIASAVAAGSSPPLNIWRTIDRTALVKAMDKSGVSRKQLADTLGLSLQYVCDIAAGRRTLKRNPDLRNRIAGALDVPVHWIERHEEEAA